MPEPSYMLAREARKEPKKEPKITMGKGMQRVEPQDPMTGVTDPTKLLKSDTQRIDKKMTTTPEQIWEKAPSGFGSEEMKAKAVQKI